MDLRGEEVLGRGQKRRNKKFFKGTYVDLYRHSFSFLQFHLKDL